MTTVLYLLIAALAFFVIWYILAKTGCASSERYLSTAPQDPVTADNGECEDEDILKAKQDAKAASEAEAQRIKEEEAAKARAEAEAQKAAEKKEAAKAKAEEEADLRRKAEAQKAAAEASAKEEAKRATKKTKNTAPKKKSAVSDTIVKSEGSAGMAPEGLLDAPRNGKKDNLTRIKGVGVKIDKALNSIGIYHFDQIAAWTEENMVWADSKLAFPGRAQRDDWVGQAKLLAEGKETEFSKRVDKGQVSSSKKG